MNEQGRLSTERDDAQRKHDSATCPTCTTPGFIDVTDAQGVRHQSRAARNLASIGLAPESREFHVLVGETALISTAHVRADNTIHLLRDDYILDGPALIEIDYAMRVMRENPIIEKIVMPRVVVACWEDKLIQEVQGMLVDRRVQARRRIGSHDSND